MVQWINTKLAYILRTLSVNISVTYSFSCACLPYFSHYLTAILIKTVMIKYKEVLATYFMTNKSLLKMSFKKIKTNSCKRFHCILKFVEMLPIIIFAAFTDILKYNLKMYICIHTSYRIIKMIKKPIFSVFCIMYIITLYNISTNSCFLNKQITYSRY